MATTGGTSRGPSAGGDALKSAPLLATLPARPFRRRLIQNAINWLVLGGIIAGVFFFLRAREKQKAAVPEQTEVPAGAAGRQCYGHAGARATNARGHGRSSR